MSIIIRFAISAGLLAFLLWSMRDNFSNISSTLSKTHLPLFSAAVALFVINVIILSARLQLLFKGEGLDIAMPRVIQLSFIGFFFNNFMPTAVGGDIVKAYYAYKQTNETTKSFISVFMDRLIGLFSFVIIAIIALVWGWANIGLTLKRIVIIFAAVSIFASVIILNKTIARFIISALPKLKIWNIGEKLSKAYRAIHDYRHKKSLIVSVIGISLISQSLYFLVVYVLIKSLGANILFASVFLIMPIVSIVSMLPSIGGLGLREGAMVALFSPMIGASNAFSVSILLLAILFILSIAGAITYISASQFKLKPAEISSFKNYNA